MFKIISLLLLTTSLCVADEVTDGTELLMTFLVHRHGDRTPASSSSLSYSKQADELEAATAKYGYGQLTDVGKQRGYDLGLQIRERYNNLLSPQYNRSEIYIRSTDSTRSKMTVLSAMAATYRPGPERWSNEVNWVPVPYTTVPVLYDYNLAIFNCPNYINGYYGLFVTRPSVMDQYADVLNAWTEFLDFNITQYPVMAYTVYDLYTAQISLGIPLETGLSDLFPEIEAVAGEAIDIVFGDESYIAMQAGVFLNEFFTVADEVVAGETVQKVQVFSAHDFNVYSLMAVSQITPRQGVPKYGSSFALELRKVTETGEYVVLPVYISSPGDEAKYLQVDGCDDLLCDLESFRNITSSYVLDYDEWQTSCGWTADQTIDDSTIA